ncbi:hypothetical protein N9L49_05925, partial [Rhodospirillales bacterium]|nr:hypothetical protein [Rhodospirillales bacterium]
DDPDIKTSPQEYGPKDHHKYRDNCVAIQRTHERIPQQIGKKRIRGDSKFCAPDQLDFFIFCTCQF